MSSPKNGSLLTVFVVVLIDLMGFGMVLPLMPFYADQFSANSLQIGLLYSVYSFAQLIFAPVWGGLSDRYGRRPIMLLSTFGASISYVIFAFSPSYFILFFSRMLAGIMGGNISAAQAYIADITPPEERAKGMGVIGAAFGIGFVIGPPLASLFLHPGFSNFLSYLGWTYLAEAALEFRFTVPGLVASILSLSSFAMVVFKLPETVTEAFKGAKLKRTSVFTRAFWTGLLEKTSEKRALSWLFLISLLLWVSQGTLYSAFPLFCDAVLGMDAAQVGIQFFYLGLVSAIVQGLLIKPITSFFSEGKVFLAGVVLMTLGMMAFALVSTKGQLLVALLLLALGNSLNLPTLNSLLSKQAKEGSVGSLLGTAQSIAGLGRVIGPTWGGFLFGFGTAVPFLSTGFLLIPAIVLTVLLIGRKRFI